MDISIKEFATVARGTFNIYIFQPPWISRLLELNGEVSDDFEVNVDFSKPGFQVRFDCLTWTVRPDAIIISTPTWHGDCGLPMGKVLKALPQTPLNAVGHNFVFRGDGALADRLIRPMWELGPDQKGIIDAYFAGQVIKIGDATFNVVCGRNQENFEVSINVHRDVSDSASCVAAAESFVQDKKAAVELITNLLKLQVSA